MKTLNTALIVVLLTIVANVIAIVIPFFQKGDFGLPAILSLVGAILAAIVAVLTQSARKQARAHGIK